jgi:hypothetical protein
LLRRAIAPPNDAAKYIVMVCAISKIEEVRVIGEFVKVDPKGYGA